MVGWIEKAIWTAVKVEGSPTVSCFMIVSSVVSEQIAGTAPRMCNLQTTFEFFSFLASLAPQTPDRNKLATTVVLTYCLSVALLLFPSFSLPAASKELQ